MKKYCAAKYFKHYLIALCGFTLGCLTFMHYALLSTCCTELTKDCFSCRIGIPAYEFCWDNPGQYDCGYRILVAITTHEKRGQVEFVSSIARRYLHLNDQDIVVFDNNSKGFNESNLLNWFGNHTTVLRPEKELTLSRIQYEILQYFTESKHEVLVLTNSNMILHNEWRDFVNSHIHQSEGLLSLCQTMDDSAPMSGCKDKFHEVNYDCGKAITKEMATRILDYRKSSAIGDFARTLPEVSIKIPEPPRSVIFLYGRGKATCSMRASPLHLNPCHFPPWIKEGIEFFNGIHGQTEEIYVEKDPLPRKDENVVKRIGVMLISSSMSATETYLKNIVVTLEHVYQYKLFLAVSDQTTAVITAVEDDLRKILYADMEFKVIPFNRNVTFSENMNRLTRCGYADGMDYFVHVPASGMLTFEEGWASCAIESITSDGPRNVGVARPSCKVNNSTFLGAVFVSRLHYDIFGMLYPPSLGEQNALKWISGVYNKVIFHPDDGDSEMQIPGLEDYIAQGYEVLKNWSRPVVSYALYGANTRYTDGAIANMELMPKYFPGWQMWVYYDDSVPLDILAKLCENRVKLIDMTDFPLKNQMSWRFLVASEPVERFIVRDIDSRLSKRDKAAVDEWVSSGKKFHTIRDHPNHALYSMNGGMWGATFDAIPNLKALLLKKNPSGRYLQDMDFLNNVIWYYYGKYSAMQHDEVSEGRFGRTRPFPLSREGTEFVGDVYIDGKQVR